MEFLTYNLLLNMLDVFNGKKSSHQKINCSDLQINKLLELLSVPPYQWKDNGSLNIIKCLCDKIEEKKFNGYSFISLEELQKETKKENQSILNSEVILKKRHLQLHFYIYVLLLRAMVNGRLGSNKRALKDYYRASHLISRFINTINRLNETNEVAHAESDIKRPPIPKLSDH